MSFRVLVITKRCKLNYKDDHLIIRSEDVEIIHLSEIHTILIQSTMVTMTSYLVAELIKKKIKVIFCDELANPSSELIPYYGSYNSSKKILLQISWSKSAKEFVWTEIVKQKILRQADHLKDIDKDEYKLLMNYYNNVELGDVTNREGHSAKVYFNSLFGKEFSREIKNDINAALDYGYTIILSAFNREIVSKGYLTQLGINHRNEFNYFNLSCDFMEPFRIFVDRVVYKNKDRYFNSEYKQMLVNLLNQKVIYCMKEYYMSNAIRQYVQNIFNYLEYGIYDEDIFIVYGV